VRQAGLILDRPDGDASGRKHELLGLERLAGQWMRDEIRAPSVGDEAEARDRELRLRERANVAEAPELIATRDVHGHAIPAVVLDDDGARRRGVVLLRARADAA